MDRFASISDSNEPEEKTHEEGYPTPKNDAEKFVEESVHVPQRRATLSIRH